MKISDLGRVAAGNFAGLSGKREAALDPATIAVFAELIFQFIAKLKECRESADSATQRLRNPGFFERVIAKRTVRDELGNKGFREKGDEVLSALYKTAENITPSDVRDMYDEV